MKYIIKIMYIIYIYKYSLKKKMNIYVLIYLDQ